MGIFLKIGKIKSDAADTNHKEWIACDSFTGGTTRPMFLETGGGMMRDTSDAELHEIGLRMKMHKGSPQMFVASVCGEACEAEIHITRASDKSGSLNYLEVKLSDTFVSHYSVDCDGDTPMETISLNFAKIETKYTPNKSDGKPGSSKTAGFSGHTGEKV